MEKNIKTECIYVYNQVTLLYIRTLLFIHGKWYFFVVLTFISLISGEGDHLSCFISHLYFFGACLFIFLSIFSWYKCIYTNYQVSSLQMKCFQYLLPVSSNCNFLMFEFFLLIISCSRMCLEIAYS